MKRAFYGEVYKCKGTCNGRSVAEANGVVSLADADNNGAFPLQ